MKDSAKNKKGAGPNAQCIDRPKALHDQFKISQPIIHIVNLLTKKFTVSLFLCSVKNMYILSQNSHCQLLGLEDNTRGEGGSENPSINKFSSCIYFKVIYANYNLFDVTKFTSVLSTLRLIQHS